MKYSARIQKTMPAWNRQPDAGDRPKHRAWIKRQNCLCHGLECGGIMHPHHVRSAANAGTGLKPDDMWCVPLCAFHHEKLHREGVETFQEWYRTNLAEAAQALWQRSPHRRKVA